MFDFAVVVSHSLQNASMHQSTVVIARAGPTTAQPPMHPSMRSSITAHPPGNSNSSAAMTSSIQLQRAPPAVVTLFSSGTLSSSPASSIRSPSLSGSSVTVLPASSRPPLSTSGNASGHASSSGSNSGVSVYPIYGPRGCGAEMASVTSVTASVPSFSSPVRLSVTSSPPVSRTTLSSSQASTPFRPVYSSAESQVHHYQVCNSFIIIIFLYNSNYLNLYYLNK